MMFVDMLERNNAFVLRFEAISLLRRALYPTTSGCGTKKLLIFGPDPALDFLRNGLRMLALPPPPKMLKVHSGGVAATGDIRISMNESIPLVQQK